MDIEDSTSIDDRQRLRKMVDFSTTLVLSGGLSSMPRIGGDVRQTENDGTEIATGTTAYYSSKKNKLVVIDTAGTFTIGPNTSIEGVQGDRYVDQAIVEEDLHKNGWLSGAVIDAYLSLLPRNGENDDVYIVPTATTAAVRDRHAFATQHPVQFPCLMTVNNANSHWYVVYATADGRLFAYNSLPHVGGSNGWGSGEENTLPQIQQWLRQKYVQQQRDANESTNSVGKRSLRV
jgi:hypothetical protein